MLKALTIIFLISLSWNGISAPGVVPNASLMLTLVWICTAFAHAFVRVSNNVPVMIRMDEPVAFGLLVLLVLVVMAGFTGGSFSASRVIFYVLPLILVLSLQELIGSGRLPISWILNWIGVGFFVVMTLTALEFLARFFFSFEFMHLLPRVRGEITALASIGDQRILRVVGLSTEPTIIIFYVNTIGPIALYALWSYTRSLALLALGTGVIIVASLGTASPAIMALILSVAVVGTSRVFLGKMRLRQSVLVKSFSVILAFFLLLYLLPASLFRRPIRAVTRYFSGAGEGGDIRATRLADAIYVFSSPENVLIKLFGNGVGFFHTSDWTMLHRHSPNNFYMVLLLEIGIVGLFIFLGIISYLAVRLICARDMLSGVLALGLIAGSIHLFVISTFFQPFYLLVLALGAVKLKMDVSAQKERSMA